MRDGDKGLTTREVVRAIEALDDGGLRSLADTLDYTAAMTLYEQLQRRLLEDGAPIKGMFDDAPRT